jgi:hypothetical protein
MMHRISSQTMQPTYVYEVRSRPDKRGFDLISDVLPFGRLWYGEQKLLEKLLTARGILLHVRAWTETGKMKTNSFVCRVECPSPLSRRFLSTIKA